MNAGSIVIALGAATVVFTIGVLATPAGAPTPPDNIFPVFAALLLLESLAFGAGVAYVLRERRVLFGPGTPALERAVAWSLAYFFLAPWPHDFSHRLTHINGVFNWPALAGIEYVFHLGIVPIGVLLGTYLIRTRRLGRA